MTKINIRHYKDQVWFLCSEGFKCGWIKEARCISDQYNPLKITYYVVHAGDDKAYMGREMPPELLFDSKEEMITYYSKKS